MPRKRQNDPGAARRGQEIPSRAVRLPFAPDRRTAPTAPGKDCCLALFTVSFSTWFFLRFFWCFWLETGSKAMTRIGSPGWASSVLPWSAGCTSGRPLPKRKRGSGRKDCDRGNGMILRGRILWIRPSSFVSPNRAFGARDFGKSGLSGPGCRRQDGPGRERAGFGATGRAGKDSPRCGRTA